MHRRPLSAYRRMRPHGECQQLTPNFNPNPNFSHFCTNSRLQDLSDFSISSEGDSGD